MSKSPNISINRMKLLRNGRQALNLLIFTSNLGITPTEFVIHKQETLQLER